MHTMRWLVGTVAALAAVSSSAVEVRLSIEAVPPSAATPLQQVTQVWADYAGTDRLVGGAVTVGFDPARLQLLQVELLAPQDVAGSTGTWLAGAGGTAFVAGIGFASFDGAGGRFALARLTWAVQQPLAGTTLTVSDAADPVFAWASDSLAPLDIVGGTLGLNAVPEPASAVLLLAALPCLAWRLRHRRPVPAGAAS